MAYYQKPKYKQGDKVYVGIFNVITPNGNPVTISSCRTLYDKNQNFIRHEYQCDSFSSKGSVWHNENTLNPIIPDIMI